MNILSSELKKLKIVWLCHFSNEEIRRNLPLSKKRLENIIRKLAGKKPLKANFDFAPWISILAKEFEQFDAVEIHVVAPFRGLKRLTAEFEIRNIHYHLFKPCEDFLLLKYVHKIPFLKKRKHTINRLLIKKLVKGQKPDLVNLFGAENPFFAVGALDFKSIPIYVSLQTVYADPLFKDLMPDYSEERKKYEIKIFQHSKYFGCSGLKHKDLVLSYNPDAYFFKFMFPVQQPKAVFDGHKTIDFVYFGSITPHKGIEELVNALYIVKQHKEDTKLQIIGKCESSYLQKLRDHISKLDLTENIQLFDYFPLQQDLFEQIMKSRIAVFPLKLDIIPSAIREAISLNLPIVTTRTSGTPFLNRDDEAVLLSDIDDVAGLANNMLKLSLNSELREKLVINAMRVYRREFDSTIIAKGLLGDYYSVYNHYYRNVPIPKESLFNENEFPEY